MEYKAKRVNVRYLTVTAMLSGISLVLMFFDFSVPVMPGFIKMDISDLPALIGSFSLGPGCGVMVCLLKNLMHLIRTSTAGVGELSNFILSASFVLPAGLIYKYHKNKKGAILASFVGALTMACLSVFSNSFITYPFYYNFMPKEVILGAYQAVHQTFPMFTMPVSSILECLIWYNAPFTFVKGMLSVVICWLIYKPLSPIIKGRE